MIYTMFQKALNRRVAIVAFLVVFALATRHFSNRFAASRMNLVDLVQIGDIEGCLYVLKWDPEQAQIGKKIEFISGVRNPLQLYSNLQMRFGPDTSSDDIHQWSQVDYYAFFAMVEPRLIRDVGTPLEAALAYDRIELVEPLLRLAPEAASPTVPVACCAASTKGLKLSYADADPQQLTILAACLITQNKAGLLQHLIDCAGASFEKLPNKHLLLQQAVLTGKLECANVLRQNGVNPSAAQLKALFSVDRNISPASFQFLLQMVEQQARNSPTEEVPQIPATAVRLMIRKGFNFNFRNRIDGLMLLQSPIADRSRPLCEMILEGKNPTNVLRGKEFYYGWMQWEEYLPGLLQAGLNPRMKDTLGNTLMNEVGRLENCQVLMDAGAEWHTDKDGDVYFDNDYWQEVYSDMFNGRPHDRWWSNLPDGFLERVKQGEKPDQDRMLDRIYYMIIAKAEIANALKAGKDLREYGIDPKHPDKHWLTLGRYWHFESVQVRLPLARYLLKKHGEKALPWIMAENPAPSVRRYLQKAYSMPTPAPDPILSILKAAESGQVALLKRLIDESKCRLNEEDWEHLLVSTKTPQSAELIVKTKGIRTIGANVFVPFTRDDIEGWQIDADPRRLLGLLRACSKHGVQLKHLTPDQHFRITKFLDASPQHIDLLRAIGYAPSTRYAPHRAARDNDLDSLETYANNNDVWLDLWDENYRLPIHYAVMMNHVEAIRLLAKRPRQVHAMDGWGRTPLHWAAMFNRPEAVKILLDAGAKVSDMDNDGATPLHFAASPEMAKTFIAAGANPDRCDMGGEFPCARQLMLERFDTFAYTFKRSKKAVGQWKWMKYAVRSPKSLRLILERNYPMAKREKMELDGHAHAHAVLAAKEGSMEALKLMLEHGADVNKTDDNQDFALDLPATLDSALHVAARRDDMKMLRYLLSIKGIKLNQRNEHGWTPADEAHSREAILILRSKGAKESCQLDGFGDQYCHPVPNE